MQSHPPTSKSYQAFQHSVSAAKRFVDLFHHIQTPTTEQLITLAAAHYTIGLQRNTSPHRAKMHLNSSITLLHNIPAPNRTLNWYSLMTNAYIKRAELLEQENNFINALMDYQKAIELYESQVPHCKIPDFDRLLLAQSAISIADLTVNEDLAFYKLGQSDHPLFYVNKALEYLARLSKEQKEQNETWITLAYAHHIAGIALSRVDLLDATEAFRTAISMAFRSETRSACRILGDIYNSLGLLYEQYFHRCTIQKAPVCLNEHAMIYFNIALFFLPNDTLVIDQEDYVIDLVFETIYHFLDPFPALFSPTLMQDLIDVLIFIYYCLMENTPNCQEAFYQLKQPDILKLYAQHIYWLAMEHQRRENPQSRLLDYANPSKIVTSVDLSDILPAFNRKQTNDNVYYLYKKTRLNKEPVN